MTKQEKEPFARLSVTAKEEAATAMSQYSVALAKYEEEVKEYNNRKVAKRAALSAKAINTVLLKRTYEQ